MTATQLRASTAITQPRRLVTRGVKALPVAGYTARYAADSLSLADGATAHRLPNLVAGLPDLSAATAAAAVVGTSGDGKRYISNTGTSTLRTTDNTFSYAAFTIVVVARQTSTPTGTGTVAGSGSPNANIGIFGGKFIGNAGTVLNGPNVSTARSVFLFAATGTSTSYFNVNGVEYSGNAGTNALTEVYTYGSASNYMQGEVFDIAVYPTALGSTDRALLVAHLMSEYGI